MNANRRKALEAAGVIFEDAEDFLELTAEERSLVELRLAVSRAVRDLRVRSNLTQTDVAKRLKTSQPNVCKMEAGSRDVSLDQMFRAFFVLGGKPNEVFLARGKPTEVLLRIDGNYCSIS
jgi:hypothetical protein